jgi:transposase InsO family protein
VDFSDAPMCVDGSYASFLAVRDLSSGMQLLWLPVKDETAGTAIAALELLFRQHGPPLVLKSDNGSAFIAAETAAMLARWQVVPLRSPPAWPAYNGACEAGIGSMKVRTHHQASAQGRSGAWTSDDAEAARQEENETARSWGVNGPTPEGVWKNRLAIEKAEREMFAVSVSRG